ncbi:MAG: phospholipid carrier-dependent glycosyltransferase [Chloroflexi bacterium]|uniref:Phospholipid carrier-dependent glycosyltransferase n=1 Tax=Candidatus Chlorohelix allophototropha TaxID=3003348 RepID=A0A8T7M0K4_9CHLR|nr:phospholipid carrier-dependent glycosyltransferase [Chloroflexota bacterium]WJW67252.1 phospholipid carrier-dependent glycosyltransferase [Chloroflexota bacterium L227-S17]
MITITPPNSKFIKLALKLWEWVSTPGLWLLIGISAIYFLTSAFDFFISDGEVMYQTAREIVLRNRIDQPATPGLTQIIQGNDGLFYSKYGLGQPLLASLFFRFGKWLWFNFMREKWDEPIAHFAVTLLPLLATALTAWLVYLIARKLYRSVKISIGLALLYALGTSAWPYAHFFFSEPLFCLCTVLAAYALLQFKEASHSWQRYLWLIAAGLAFGYAILTRVSGIALLPAFALYLWLICKNRPRDFIKYGLVFGAAVFPSFALTAIFNQMRFGNPLSSGYEGEGFTTPIWEGLWGLLFSTGKSVFLYSPVLVAVPFAMRPFSKRFRPEAYFFGAIILITLVYYAAWWAWYGGFSWGPRFMVPVLPFAIIFLGALLENSRKWVAVLFVGLFPLAIFVQMLGVTVNFNTHLGNITHYLPGWDANYIFIPAYSPIRAHFELFWNPDNNVIRSLSLDQLGLTTRMAKVFGYGAILCFLISLFMVCYAYLRTNKRESSPRINNIAVNTSQVEAGSESSH